MSKEEEVKKIHDLKTWPMYFQAVKTGVKTAEFRKNDRDFQIGDCLNLQEWNPKTQEYTGDSLMVQITHIVQNTCFGMEEGYCLISFRQLFEPKPDEELRKEIVLFQLNLQRKYMNLPKQDWIELTDVVKEEYLKWADQILAKTARHYKARIFKALEDMELIKNHNHKKGEAKVVACPRCTYEEYKAKERNEQ